jgi:hypothetical protein
MHLWASAVQPFSSSSPTHDSAFFAPRLQVGVVSLMLGRFAVIDRRSGNVVEAGFRSFEQGWIWVAERVAHDCQ